MRCLTDTVCVDFLLHWSRWNKSNGLFWQCDVALLVDKDGARLQSRALATSPRRFIEWINISSSRSSQVPHVGAQVVSSDNLAKLV